MAGCRAPITRKEYHGLSDESRVAANDEVTLPLLTDIPLLTISKVPALPSCSANDDWIEEDLPVSINVLAEEVVLLHQHLRANILALFD